jgi:hypothetical protein
MEFKSGLVRMQREYLEKRKQCKECFHVSTRSTYTKHESSYAWDVIEHKANI